MGIDFRLIVGAMAFVLCLLVVGAMAFSDYLLDVEDPKPLFADWE